MKEIIKTPMFRFLMLMTICSTVGLQGWRTLFDNFAVHSAGLNGSHVGIIQSVREIPGFLTFTMIYFLLIVSEHRFASLSVVAMGIGIGLAGFFPSFLGLTFTTLLMSFGFHYYEAANQSLTLQYFSTDKSPRVFGRLRSLSAATNIAVGVLIFLLDFILDARGIFLMMGAALVGMGLWGSTMNPADKTLPRQNRRIVLKKEYRLFYILTFLLGREEADICRLCRVFYW